ncbi:MAG TPA: M3 family metallopeptidase, partial [Myxococcales bacterium]|nr:M3 family metallopeptidase [Myxococcales bacterium]
MLIATLVLLSAAAAAAPPSSSPPPPAGPGIDWKRSAGQVTSICKAELARGRARVKAALAVDGKSKVNPPPLERLIAVETAVAEMDEAMTSAWVLSTSPDASVRAAAAACGKSHDAFSVELRADPALYAVAAASQSSAQTTADRALAQRYMESGRRGGAALDPRARAELTALLDQIHQLESDYVRALGDSQAKAFVDLSAEEAASLPPSFAQTLKKAGKGFKIPVSFATGELVLKNLRSGAARERYLRAYFQLGGAANVDRLKRVLALRRRAAQRLGYLSWAEYRLDGTSARTPERALPMVRGLGAALLPRAKAELKALAALKTAEGEPGPFTHRDYPFYRARFEQSSFAVDPEEVRQYFPVDVVVPAALGVFEQVLGLRFEPVEQAPAWAPGVLLYAVKDAASGALLGWCYLDVQPREGKAALPSASLAARLGRALPGGDRVLPVTVIFTNVAAVAPGERALFTHQGVVELFHELGHMAHSVLSTAPYASLSGALVRPDFVEAPSQLFEAWAWDPAVLRRVSRHVRTGEPLPQALAEKLAGLRRASVGVDWTRRVFGGIWDLEINGPSE